MALPSKQRGLLLVYAMPVLLLACGLTTGFDVYDTTPPTYKVGGKVTGLEGSDNAYLRLNGGPDLTVGNAAFVFPTQLADGAPYVVDVDTSATVAKCTVSNGSGTIAGSDVTNVLVNCGSGKSALATIALSAPPASVGPLVPPFSFGDHFNFSALVKLPVLPQVVSNPTLQIFAPPQDAHAIVAPAFSSPDTGNPSPLTPCPTPETSCWFGVLPSGRTQLNITVTAPDGQTTSTYIVILTSVWSHYLKPSNNRQIPFGGAKMAFGSAVSIDGTTLAVGAPGDPSCTTGPLTTSCLGAGTAYVFQGTGGFWTEQQLLKASNTTNGGHNPGFGASVGVSGDTIVVGAPAEASCMNGVSVNPASDQKCPDAGAAYVFVQSGAEAGQGTWSLQAYLKASNTLQSSSFGTSVAISGDTIVVGAPGESSCATGVDGNQSDTSCVSAGAAYVFVRSNGTWSQQAYFKASNTAAGNAFGTSVALAGNTAIVGAPRESGGSDTIDGDGGQPDSGAFSSAGAAYVFGQSGSTWAQQAYVKASDNATNSVFGSSVAMAAVSTGSNAVVGAPSLGWVAGGEAFEFGGAGKIWSQDGQPATTPFSLVPGNAEHFGAAVGIDVGAANFVVGASGDPSCAVDVTLIGAGPDASAADAEASFAPTCFGEGAAFVGASPTSLTMALKPQNRGFQFGFGSSVAISGGTIAVGTPNDPSCTQGSDGDPTSNPICAGAGAVYVY